MLDMRRPDIVVGIDIGQTCSGVAYSIGPDWSDPKTINQWPSNDGMEKADKVATRVGYSKTRKTLRNWGFESVFGDETIEVREQFKLTLDPKYQDYRPYSCHDARQWYFDYLTCLHRQIENYFDTVIPRFRTMNVEYSFSTPTTWTNPAMIASLEKLIKKAGFAGTVNRTVRIALTEAEAAAIEASTTQYRKGDIFLICDAGGGTTDVNTLRVKSTDGRIELEPLDHVEGVSVGSTLIDFKMAEHIGGRLQLIKEHLDQDPIYLAEEMLAGKFQTVKHSFPNPPVEQFSLDVKGLAGSQSFPEAGIVNSKMIIDRSTLKDFFDEQITQIFHLIDERLMALETGFPDQQVSYVILSGGLGSSPYLYMEVKRRYEMNYGFKSNNTSLIRIMRVLEPQLAVVRGLVRERTQQLGLSTSIGQEVFKTRRCRNSYGIVVRAPYDETKHQGLQFFKDNLNRGRWVPNLVEWFVKEGEEIKVGEGIPRRYTATLGEHDHHNTREAQIVMSSLPAGQLPQLTTDKGCEKVVMIKYQLTGNDMKLKNRQLWKVGKKYWKAEFIFVVNIGPADLRFNIVGKNGVLSSGHDKLDVEFMDPYQEQSSPKSQVATEFIRDG